MQHSARRFTDSVAFSEQGNLLDFIAAGYTEWRIEKPSSKSGKWQKRKLGVVRLELVKFCSDVGKALYDCELPFAHEGVFIGCSLFSGVLSTHKNIFKIYKD